MFDLNIDAYQLQQFKREMLATDAQMRKALVSTLTELARNIRVQARRGLSAEQKLRMDLVRRRLSKLSRIKTTPNGAETSVWFGLNPMQLRYLDPKRTASGVKTKQLSVDGAFMAKPTKSSGMQQVFKRRGSARLPLDVMKYQFKDPTEDFIEHRLLDSAWLEERFFTIFERQLKWRTMTA